MFPAPVPDGLAWGEQRPDDPAWAEEPGSVAAMAATGMRGSSTAGARARKPITDARAGGSAAVTPVPGGRQRVGSRRRSRNGGLWLGVWPLLAVLAVQAVLSLRLVGADTAFQDEATYLWAGHLQWAHWLHGKPIPPFPAYFSGAPVIYPPLGALADSAGGLAGARVLSLVFMLGATVLLWSSAARLFGRRAAFFAAALFAVLGPTLHLGAFATYDALSVLLVAFAAWCVIRAGDRGEGTGWMVAAGAALAVANAAAYSSALFDLVVLALALLTAAPAGGRLAARRCAILLITVTVLVTVGMLIGGRTYLTGVEQTTLARVASNDSPFSVLIGAWSWTGVVLVLAVGGVIISWASRAGRMQTWLLAVLAAAAVLGPVEQARLHTLASLNKHVGLGAWFAAIAAGYAVDRFIAAAPAGRTQALTCGACVVALVFPTALGASQSWVFSTDWPNASSFIAIFGPLADHSSGHLLVEDASIARYYLSSGSNWRRWSSTRNIVLPSGANTAGPSSAAGVTGAGNAGVYAAFITHGYFSYIALNFADTTALDHKLADQLHRDPRYHIIAAGVIPYGTPANNHGTYIIWRYEPPS
jgi:Dolichyl-phosphate-mannose-protein mannosyltransferase